MQDNECKAFAKRIVQLYVVHSNIKKIWDMLDSVLEHQQFMGSCNTPRHLFITGKSSTGKSQLAKHYATSRPGYINIAENGDECDIRPVVYVELPDPFTILELYQSIIRALGAPTFKSQPRIGEVKDRAFKLIAKQRVQMIILDEMNYILSSKYVKHVEAMEAIKYIGNTANVSLVCMGSPETAALRQLNFQYFRRFTHLKLEKFQSCDEGFCALLGSIEEQIAPSTRIGLGDVKTKLPLLIFHMSKGLVGIVTETIQEAYRLNGVFDDSFNDITKAQINADILYKAYQNIVGDIPESEFNKMLESDKCKVVSK